VAYHPKPHGHGGAWVSLYNRLELDPEYRAGWMLKLELVDPTLQPGADWFVVNEYVHELLRGNRCIGYVAVAFRHRTTDAQGAVLERPVWLGYYERHDLPGCFEKVPNGFFSPRLAMLSVELSARMGD
jgi:hypothetical protein